MWIFTTEGFISVVEKPGETELTVRARDERSLATLSAAAGVSVIETPMADYPFRIIVSREVLSAWLVEHVDGLDYSNFKSAVGRSRGWDYSHALSAVWADMQHVTRMP
jgi:hypothetical protein